MPCCRPAELEWFASKAMNAGKEAAREQRTQQAGRLLQVTLVRLSSLVSAQLRCCRGSGDAPSKLVVCCRSRCAG